MTEKTLTELQNRLRYGDSNHDKIKTGLVIDITDSFVHKDDDGVAELAVLDDVTATAAELNAAADVSSRLVSIADATTYTVLAANSGKPHVLPDLTASCTISLPTPASGLEYEFYYSGIAADGQDWVIDTGSDTNFFLGGLVHLDTNADAAGDEVVPVAGDGDSNSILTVVTPNVGTRVKVVCDGTNWILSGFVASETVPSFANQA